MKKKLSYHISVHGRVQGVGFRYWAQKTADSIGVKGFVKNMVDGSVFIEAEGTEIELSKFVSRCKVGPGWSHVERVEVEEFPTRGYDKFRIKY